MRTIEVTVESDGVAGGNVSRPEEADEEPGQVS